MTDLIKTTVSILDAMKKHVKQYKTDAKLLDSIKILIKKSSVKNLSKKSSVKSLSKKPSVKSLSKKPSVKNLSKKSKKVKVKGKGLLYRVSDGPNTIHEDKVWELPKSNSENNSYNSYNSYNNSYNSNSKPIELYGRQGQALARKLAHEEYQSHHYILLLICIYYATMGETLNATIYLIMHAYLMNT